jgi:hypothetical protein
MVIHVRDKQAKGLGQHRALLIIVLGFLLLGGLYSWLVPPFEGPDEAQHFAYISWLAEGKGFPPQDRAWETPIEQEAGQPPLYYLLASIPARLVGTTNPTAEYRLNPYFVGPLPRPVPDNDNRAIHYPEDARPLRGGWLAFYLARSIVLLFGVLLIVSVYGLARQVRPNDPQIAVGAAFLTAVTPQILFISSVASNDIPAAAFSALTLWLFSTLLRQEPTSHRAFLTGVALGLAGLCKISALTLALPLAIGLAWLGWSGRYSWRYVLEKGVWLGLGAGLTAGWWFVRVWLLYGSPLGLGTHDQTPWAVTDPAELSEFLPRWREVFWSYWASFGWGTIRPNGWVYTILFGFTLAAIVGLALLFRRWYQQNGQKRSSTTAALMLSLAAALLIVSIFLEMWMHRVIAPYGRLIFPATGAVSIFLIMGWRAIHPRLVAVACGAVTVLALVLPFTELIPTYTFPPFISADEVTQNVDIRFGLTAEQPIAQLLSVTPRVDTVVAGNLIPIDVCWRTLAETDQEYTVLVHIIGPNNSLIADRRTYPGLGLYPTSIWQPDKIFCDFVNVRVWESMPETLLYKIEVAMLDEATGERLQPFNAQGELLSQTFVDEVKLVVQKPPPPPELSGDEAIQLIDYVVDENVWRAGDTYTLSLEWGVAMPVTTDYQLFVHLRDPVTNEVMAQADGPPLAGWYPTSWWSAEELIKDERPFPLPPDMRPGQYNLVVGFYDLLSGERFGSEYFLGTVEVVAPNS